MSTKPRDRVELEIANLMKEAKREIRHSEVAFAYRARVAGADGLGDPDKPFSHLEGLRAEGIDWNPQMPEPSMPRRLADA